MKFKRWNIGAPPEETVARLREAGYPYLLSTVLASRGIQTPEEAAELLEQERTSAREEYTPVFDLTGL